MQVNFSEVFKIFIMIWFCGSLFAAIIGNLLFWLWLRRRVNFGYFLISVPGYLDKVYIEWCRSKGLKPNRKLLLFRVVSFVSVIISSIVAVLTVLKQ